MHYWIGYSVLILCFLILFIINFLPNNKNKK